MASAEGGPLAQRGASFQLAKNLKQGELRATLKKIGENPCQSVVKKFLKSFI
jgi:hypothetical protein